MNNYNDAGTLTLLEHLRAKPPSFVRDELIRAAERGRFHDYASKDATPKVLLRNRLLSAGWVEMAEHCVDGLYDQGKEEAERWAETDEGRATIAAFKKGSAP